MKTQAERMRDQMYVRDLNRRAQERSAILANKEAREDYEVSWLGGETFGAATGNSTYAGQQDPNQPPPGQPPPSVE